MNRDQGELPVRHAPPPPRNTTDRPNAVGRVTLASPTQKARCGNTGPSLAGEVCPIRSERKGVTVVSEYRTTSPELPITAPRVTGVARLDARISVLGPDDCWPWLGYIGTDGYGKLRYGGAGTPSTTAHRLVYEALHGPLPAGMVVDHTCHNGSGCAGGRRECMHRRCVNPAHLEAVTSRENTLRGEGPAAHAARKAHCAKGHPLTDDARSDGSRGCPTCIREQVRERERAKYRKRTEARRALRAAWAAQVAADQAEAEARRNGVA